jgi:multidrug efflux pump subunit AcrA (membrane-fusion protein)
VSDPSGHESKFSSEPIGGEGLDLTRENLEPTLPRSPMSLTASARPGLSSVRRLGASLNSRRIVAGILLVLLLLGLVGIVLHNLPPNLEYADATVGNLTISFDTTGVLQSAAYGANFVEPGRLAEIDVTIGQQVTQGQVLAKLDVKLLNDAVNTAQANVTAAQTQLSDAQGTQAAVQQQTSADVAAALDKEQVAIAACSGTATSTPTTTATATPTPTSASSCVTSAKDAYSAAQAAAAAQNQAATAAVDAAQSTLTTAEASLQTAEDAQNNAVLTASHAGTVAAIMGAVGDTVGGPGTTFIRLVDLGALQVQTMVNVASVGSITSSTVFRLTVPDVGKQQFGGSLEGVSPLGEQVHGVLMYPVVINVDMQSTNGADLLPGMPTNVVVITEQRTGVLLIPASAVSFAAAAGNAHFGGFLKHSQIVSVEHEAEQLLLQLQNSGSVSSADNPTPAYVLRYVNSHWVVVPVVLGLTDGHVYEVLAGLHVGERVVTGWAGGSVTVPTPTRPPGS